MQLGQQQHARKGERAGLPCFPGKRERGDLGLRKVPAEACQRSDPPSASLPDWSAIMTAAADFLGGSEEAAVVVVEEEEVGQSVHA